MANKKTVKVKGAATAVTLISSMTGLTSDMFVSLNVPVIRTVDIVLPCIYLVYWRLTLQNFLYLEDKL